VKQGAVTLRFLATPDAVNFGGKVHGGTVMKWIDEAGYACATAWSQRYCVTVFVGGIRFLRPIAIGDLVEVEARLAYTGARSMSLAVSVRSGDLKEMTPEPTAECAVVFVAVDSHGQAVATPPFDEARDPALAGHVRALLARAPPGAMVASPNLRG
jgi:acyl-CoA hydrolase